MLLSCISGGIETISIFFRNFLQFFFRDRNNRWKKSIREIEIFFLKFRIWFYFTISREDTRRRKNWIPGNFLRLLKSIRNEVHVEKLSSWRDLRNFSTNRCILNFEQNARYRSKRLIFIYRPSNASIIWTHNGGCKFINQHDFVGFIAI